VIGAIKRIRKPFKISCVRMRITNLTQSYRFFPFESLCYACKICNPHSYMYDFKGKYGKF
jgi:hypothetical protein